EPPLPRPRALTGRASAAGAGVVRGRWVGRRCLRWHLGWRCLRWHHGWRCLRWHLVRPCRRRGLDGRLYPMRARAIILDRGSRREAHVSLADHVTLERVVDRDLRLAVADLLEVVAAVRNGDGVL